MSTGTTAKTTSTTTVKRGVARGKVTRLITKLTEIDDDDDLEEHNKIFELDAKLKSLIANYEQVREYDQELFGETKDNNDLETLMNETENVNEKTTDAIDTFSFKLLVLQEARRERIEKAKKAEAATRPTPPPPTHLVHNSKIPKFDLPDFCGVLIQWHSFWDVFEAEVHNNPNFSDATKFNYLNSRMQGPAKASIAGLAPTNENYKVAIDILKERFGQPKKVQAAHMRALYTIEKPNDSRASLSQFADRVESLIRGLEALKVKLCGPAGDLLVCILMDKLSANVRRSLIRQHGSTEFDLEELRKVLKHEIEILDDSSTPQEDVKRSSNFERNQPKPDNRHRLQNSSKNGTADKPFKPRCAFCTGEHSSMSCDKFTTPEACNEQARKLKLCYNCLSSEHGKLNCTSKWRCKHCRESHHTKLHFFDSTKSKEPSKSNATKTSELSVVATQGPPKRPFTFLETAVATVKSNHSQKVAKILFDQGAQRTIVTSSFARALCLAPIAREQLKLTGFQSDTANTSPQLYDITSLSIMDLAGQSIRVEAIILDHIANPLENPFRVAAANLPHIRGLQLAHPTKNSETLFDIDILLGADHYWSIVGDEIVRGNGPTAVNSRLGYLLSGPYQATAEVSSKTVAIAQVTSIEQFDLERFWTVEHLGITPEKKKEANNALTSATVLYKQQGLEFVNNQYVAKFPWQETHSELKSNYFISMKRTRALVTKLAKDPEKLKVYDGIIQQQLANEFIEKVPWSNRPGCHYVPHFGVERPESKTTPVRIVMDWATKTTDGVSLNDCLESGEALQNRMLDILIGFRLWKIGIVFDITKAFHKILLHDSDRDFTRFLWLSDATDPSSAFDVYRSKVVPFGAKCSPFILNCVENLHLSKFDSQVARDILRNIYVDNLASGRDTKEEALQYFNESNDMMYSASLHLNSWGFSEPSLEAKAQSKGIADSTNVSNVLGLQWDRQRDTLQLPQFALSSFCLEKTTKRLILRGISLVYDPLGLYSPLTIAGKILIQELWKLNLGWDEQVSSDLSEQWKSIATALERVTMILPRSYFGSSSAVDHLHVFVDASPVAYGAVAYLVGNGQSAFVMSKSRVAQLKITGRQKPTIPLLELMAAVLGTEVATTILQVLEQNGLKIKVTFWGDNQAVLYQIHQSQPNKCQVVENRTKIIKRFNFQYNALWRYVPSLENPADLLTRGITVEQFNSSQLWKVGPTWLLNSENWPIWDVNLHPSLAVHFLQSLTISPPVVVQQHLELSNVIDPTRYSWKKLIRLTATVLRVVNNFLATKRGEEKVYGPYTSKDLQTAELKWIAAEQSTFLKDEQNYLKTGKGARPALVSQLDLFLDQEQEVIRCGGRLRNALISQGAKNPIFIPRQSPLAKLIILYYHEKNFHSGTGNTVTSIRQRFRITCAGQTVKVVLRACTRCRRENGSPFVVPDHAPLPEFRVASSFPFTATGIDYTGAIIYRTAVGDAKAYISLFACAFTRAIHLELVTDNSAAEFIQGFRRFVSHHSLPKLIVTDNSTTNTAGNKVVQRILKNKEVQAFCQICRLIGSSFLLVVRETSLDDRNSSSFEELRTLVAEIEAVINDRPLTKVSTDVKEKDAITPSHLLYGKRLTVLPYDVSTEEFNDPNYEPTAAHLIDFSKRQAKAMANFQKIFRHEYLVGLREYHQSTKGRYVQIIKVGDVVLVDDNGPRTGWPMAVVEKLIVSKDGCVRAADIRTVSGKTNRPIAKLVPIEVTEPFVNQRIVGGVVSAQQQESSISTSHQSIDLAAPSRPKRQAAIAAHKKIPSVVAALRHE